MHCFKFAFLQPERKTCIRKTQKATERKMLIREVNDDCIIHITLLNLSCIFICVIDIYLTR